MNLLVKRPVLVAVAVLLFLAGCISAGPDSGLQNDQAQDNVYFLRQRPSDAPDMAALFQGQLVLSEKCLYIRREDGGSTHAAIWPFEFSSAVQGNSIQILNGNKKIIARVGDQILVSGGGIPQLPSEDFEENFIGPATQCTAPYWIINNDVQVVTQ